MTLLGRNGMGKTSTIRAILGMIDVTGGSVRFRGRDCTGRPSFETARLGIGLVPEGRHVFPTLSVEENLIATAHRRPGARWGMAEIYDLFPRLKERAGHAGRALSGGEQQMLAIGRALMTNPRLLILDEATEGLAPLVRAQIWETLALLKAQGEAILVVDKNVDALLALADRHVVLEKGRSVWSGSSAALAADPAVIERYLHL